MHYYGFPFPVSNLSSLSVSENFDVFILFSFFSATVSINLLYQTNVVQFFSSGSEQLILVKDKLDCLCFKPWLCTKCVGLQLGNWKKREFFSSCHSHSVYFFPFVYASEFFYVMFFCHTQLRRLGVDKEKHCSVDEPQGHGSNYIMQ